MAAPLTITSARIPSGDAPICGVTLVPYVMVRRSDGQSCNAEDCPEEGSGDARFALRFRWYRSVVNRGGAVCFIHQVPWCSTVMQAMPAGLVQQQGHWAAHSLLKLCSSQTMPDWLPPDSPAWREQDREATLQCILCLRAKVELRKSYSCSTDCLRQHWGLHKDLHVNGEALLGPFVAGHTHLLGPPDTLWPQLRAAVEQQVTRRTRMAMLWRPASSPIIPSATAARRG